MEQKIYTLFDYNKINLNNYSNMHTLVLMKNETQIGKIDFMSNYSGSSIEIINFDSYIQRKGYGRLLMTDFFKLVQWYNEFVKGVGFKKGVLEIWGKIVPNEHKISYRELVEVYMKLGFDINENKFVMRIEDINNKL